MRLHEILERWENTAVDVIAVFAPWLAPIPSAYVVGTAVHRHLDWHWLIAVIAAVAVESIGVVSILLALRLYEWNETKRKSDPGAPFVLALASTAVYFVVTIGLSVVLDVVPGLARFAPAIFPLLAAVGAVNIAMKNGQRRRELERRERSGKRSGRRSRTVPAARSNETAGTKRETAETPDETMDETAVLLAYLSANPDASFAEAGREVGKSKSWAYRQAKRLETAGMLRRNGHGWEVK